MTALIASLACFVLVYCSYAAVRDRSIKSTFSLIIPTIWILIGATRNISAWLQVENNPYADRYMEGSPLDRNVLALLILCGLIILARRWREASNIIRLNLPILLYFCYCGLSILWSDYPVVGAKRWFRALGDVVMILVIASHKETSKALSRILTTIALITIPTSILFTRYFPSLGRSYSADGTQFWTGVAEGKNGLGVICMIFGLATLWQWLLAYKNKSDKNRTRRLMVYSAVLLMSSYLLKISDSKTSLVIFVLLGGLMIAIMLTNFGRSRLRVAVASLFIVGSCISALFLDIGSGALEAVGRNSTLTGRTDVWKLVMQFSADPLFGAGYENFWLGERLARITAINGGINQAHNGYLEIYLNLGWIGVFLLAVLIVLGFWRTVKRLKPEDELSVIRLVYVITAVIFNFTEGGFKMMFPIWITFLFSILVIPAPVSVTQAEVDRIA